MNLAFALAMRQNPAGGRLRVGLLDLDIFGPSVPKLMGLESADEPRLTEGPSPSISLSWCLSHVLLQVEQSSH